MAIFVDQQLTASPTDELPSASSSSRRCTLARLGGDLCAYRWRRATTSGRGQRRQPGEAVLREEPSARPAGDGRPHHMTTARIGGLLTVEVEQAIRDPRATSSPASSSCRSRLMAGYDDGDEGSKRPEDGAAAAGGRGHRGGGNGAFAGAATRRTTTADAPPTADALVLTTANSQTRCGDGCRGCASSPTSRPRPTPTSALCSSDQRRHVVGTANAGGQVAVAPTSPAPLGRAAQRAAGGQRGGDGGAERAGCRGR